MTNVLLLSTYELGHQPLGLARPAADLTAAGHAVDCLDLAVDHLDEARVRAAELIGISVPMHTATRLGARLAEQVRALNPRAHLAFYGLYAGLHADVLLGLLADSVIGGEFEGPLVALASALAKQRSGGSGSRPAETHGSPAYSSGVPSLRSSGRGLRPGQALSDAQDLRTEDPGVDSGAPRVVAPIPEAPVPGVQTVAWDGGVFLGRQVFGLPRREILPPLDRYARVDVGDRRKLAGYVEASRGCAHRCLHCPITPVYAGRLRIVGQDAVLDDVDQLVRMGAEHITFGDPDFFNGIRHSLRIVEALHAAHPHVTFDATIKVEHILEHRQHVPTLARRGCLFLVSAVEAVQDHILANFQKGHTAADVVEALRITAAAGLPMRPTFVPFTPWTSLDDYLGLLDFVARHGLVRHVDPIQLAIRLLVPRGSSLVGTPAMAPHLGPFDPETFSHLWAHPDPRVDALQAVVAARVEQAIRAGEDAADTFAAVVSLAEAAAGPRHRPVAPVQEPTLVGAGAGGFVPRLTESWFC